jgi:hypothetical protein
MSEQQTATSEKRGDPISAERQSELQGYLDRWAAETEHEERKGPFDGGPDAAGVHLTGADVPWLAEQSGGALSDILPYLHIHLETLYVNTELHEGRAI